MEYIANYWWIALVVFVVAFVLEGYNTAIAVGLPLVDKSWAIGVGRRLHHAAGWVMTTAAAVVIMGMNLRAMLPPC
jgi:hypothetical protein